jgi:LPS sulfotransferase NodH
MIETGHMGRVLLDEVGERPVDPMEDGPRLAQYDWRGVSPYLMFFTGRCGSTWLSTLLASTGLAGNPQEFFNESVVHYEPVVASSLRGYLDQMVARYSSAGRFGAQVDADRIREIGGLIDWPTVFPVARPSFFLYRRDLLAQAWSWVSARKTDQWHTSQGVPPRPEWQDAQTKPDLPTPRELIDEMVRLRRNEEALERFFDRHGYRPHYLDYEALATDPATTVAAILRHLGATPEEIREAPPGTAVGHDQLKYGDKAHALSDFAYSHAAPLATLNRNRTIITSDELAGLFA